MVRNSSSSSNRVLYYKIKVAFTYASLLHPVNTVAKHLFKEMSAILQFNGHFVCPGLIWAIPGNPVITRGQIFVGGRLNRR